MIRDIVHRKGKTYDIKFIDSKDFSKLKPIRQVSGVLFNKKGRILVVNINSWWIIPGGKPEKGETPKQTLMREAAEEGDVEIKDIKPIGYHKVICKYKNGKIRRFYQLRYAARILKINKQTIDPAIGYIPERKFVTPKDFFKYCSPLNTNKAVLERALMIIK